MTTLQDQSLAEASSDVWHQALTKFRARAQQLFESQQDRISFLEEVVAEQLDGEIEASLEAVGEPSPASPGREEQELRTQLAQTRKQLNVRADELKRLRAQLSEAAGQSEFDGEQLLEEISELRMERDQLVARVADSEHGAQQTSAGDAAQLDDLRQRFEKAVQEIRELKTNNADLEAAAARNANAQPAAMPDTSSFNWEEQKRRLLGDLDGDQATSGDLPTEDRPSIESTIRITDEIVARKDREIAELRALLNDPTSRTGTSKEEDAIADLLDRDEVIQAEREKLSLLQDEWREKLRRAEIDLSVERAKLARDRAELDERVRVFEAQRTAFSAAGGDAMADQKSRKQQSGRWLSRLGLKDDDG